MWRKFLQILFFMFLAALQSCNTLYNSKVISIQVLVPGKAKTPKDYTKLAVKYNNSNIAFNPLFAGYFEDTTMIMDTKNLDSIASLVYFDVCTDFIRSQNYFDSVTVLNPFDFSNISISDSLVKARLLNQNAVDLRKTKLINPEVLKIANLVNRFKSTGPKKDTTLLIDPEFGFYTRAGLEEIAKQTNADIFLSFDFFAESDGIYSPDYYLNLPDSPQKSKLIEINKRTAEELVYIYSSWNIYDLKNLALTFAYQNIDTINWIEPAYNLREAKRVLPPRKDAIFNAADVAGTQFGEYISPHWVNVDRMYYQSGHSELKKTDKMVAENHWLNAVEIWKKNTTNRNKKIAAKSMFNLALACEMQGEIDAAMDWAVKSFYVFGNKNEIHAFNTQQYIRILGQRKLDIKKIEN
ncbi:MAG: DUF6340 family protein [Draconibacterium sp.]